MGRLLSIASFLLLLRTAICIPPPPNNGAPWRSYARVSPPHCTNPPISTDAPSLSAPSAIHKELQYMNFDIGLHQTVCFRMEGADSDNRTEHQSWLHTIKLDELEHHHPVEQQYEFAIPDVNVSCICECESSDKCNADLYEYKECPSFKNSPTVSCYRTFFTSQSSSGCSSGDTPNLCCEVELRPWQDRSFTAIKIKQPQTFGTFVYTAYDFQEGSWVVKDTSTIRVSLDGGSQDRSLDSLHRLELSVSAGGRASHQLETGMYFAPTNRGSNIDGLRQMPLNEIDDISYDRLGWYRRDADPKFRAYNGLVRFQRVHAVQTTDCKNQKFNSFLDAAHYAGRVDANITPNFTLPRTLEQIHPWIRKAYFYDWKKPGSSSRTVVVSHTEGTNLKIWLKAVGNKENPIRFYQNSSAVADFTGTIVVDAKSNRYFNVTFIEASGKINGEVKDGQDVDDLYVMGFTTYINELNPVNKTLTIPLPAIVGPGTRMICVRPDESPEEKRICHLVTYHETPIEMNMERNSWLDFSGDCPSCNQVKLSNMLKRLNPLSLFDGVKDLGDTVMMLSSVLIYILGLLLAYQVITRVIIPCFECCGWCFRALPTRDAKDVKRQETHYHIESLTVTDPKQLPSMLACACAECAHKPKHAKSPPPRYGSPENGIDI